MRGGYIPITYSEFIEIIRNPISISNGLLLGIYSLFLSLFFNVVNISKKNILKSILLIVFISLFKIWVSGGFYPLTLDNFWITFHSPLNIYEWLGLAILFKSLHVLVEAYGIILQDTKATVLLMESTTGSTSGTPGSTGGPSTSSTSGPSSSGPSSSAPSSSAPGTTSNTSNTTKPAYHRTLQLANERCGYPNDLTTYERLKYWEEQLENENAKSYFMTLGTNDSSYSYERQKHCQSKVDSYKKIYSEESKK